MRQLLGLLLSLAVSPACVHAPPQLSPEGKTAFHVRRVLIAVEALQEIAIDAEANGIISTDDARAVVKASVTCAKAAKTLGVALQAGYTEADTQRKMLSIIRATLQELPSHLSPKAYELTGPYIQAVLSLLVIYGY